MTAADSSAAVRRLDALFSKVQVGDVKPKVSLGKRNSGLFEKVIIEQRIDEKCDIHGRDSKKNSYGPRRGSVGSVLHAGKKNTGMGTRRESTPALHILHNYHHASPLVRKDSGGLGLPPAKSPDSLVHPSSFPSSLRQSTKSLSTSNLRRDSNGSSSGSTLNLRGNLRRDSKGSTLNLRGNGSARKDSGGLKKNGSTRKESLSRKFSTDSLESRRNSWDPTRRDSSLSSPSGMHDSIFSNLFNGKVRSFLPSLLLEVAT